MTQEKIFTTLKKVFKNKILIQIIISIASSVFTIVIVFFVIIYNKNSILDKIFAERNKQISEMINSEIAQDTTLLEAEKLLENNANEKVLQEEKLKEEALKNAKIVSPKSIVDIVQSANPAVVSITLYNKDRKNMGSGSGFLISSDGMILTNRHVVDAKNVDYEVTFNNGTTKNATILAMDPIYDVAILKIPSGKYTYLELGDSDKLNVGESVVAIGNALGELKNSVSVGIVSGLSRSVVANGRTGVTERLEKVIQTDAGINKGNSGGPLIDLYGKVIGVNVAIAEGSQSVSFALPINGIKDIISSVKKTGKIVRPYVGVRYVVINEALQLARDLPVAYGILVVKGDGENDFAVVPGSPAEKSGILEGDIITMIDNKTISRDEDFALIIRNKKVGDTVAIKLLRNKVEKVIYLVLGEAK